jgi:hypothetical protein
MSRLTASSDRQPAVPRIRRFQPVQKMPIIHASSGGIWKIPDHIFFLANSARSIYIIDLVSLEAWDCDEYVVRSETDIACHGRIKIIFRWEFG